MTEIELAPTTGVARPAARPAIGPTIGRLLVLAPAISLTVVAIAIAGAPEANRLHVGAIALLGVVAGLSATSVGVFGGVLVPGLLLLGLEPRIVAPLSLGLQVLVIPLGATTHAVVGNVKRAITVPLIGGGIIGSVAGAALASSVSAELVARLVALVIAAVGLIVLASLRTSGAAGSPDREAVHPARIGSIGVVAGFASGISGAGWGPIGVKLLILSCIDPREAIGSSLVGRIAMAIAAIATYAVTAGAHGGLALDPRPFVVLLAASGGAMVPGTLVLSRLGRRSVSAVVAVLSVGLALPSLLRLG